MSVRWTTREDGTFEVRDRQDPVAVFFGSALLFFAALFLYWLASALIELARHGSWRDLLFSVPGFIVGLAMASLFGIPGILIAFLSRRTQVFPDQGIIRHTTRYGVLVRTREIPRDDVRRVVAEFRTTKGSRLSSGWSRGGVEVHTVEIELTSGERVELAQLEKWEKAMALARQLGAFLGVECRG